MKVSRSSRQRKARRREVFREAELPESDARSSEPAPKQEVEAVEDHATIRDNIEKKLLEKVTQTLMRVKDDGEISARRAEALKMARLAQIRPFLRLPPSRKHSAEGAPHHELVVTHPTPGGVGQVPLSHIPLKVDIWTLMMQNNTWFLPLSVARPMSVCVQRMGEDFASVCGFSAAFGPLLVRRMAIFYGDIKFADLDMLTPNRLATMLKGYWENQLGPSDAAGRIFRVVHGCHCSSGGISREELRPFILAIAQRHPYLYSLPAGDMSLYVETVLAVAFYRHSRCGVISLRILRASDFTKVVNSVGRLEEDLEASEYFSYERHKRIRGGFNSLSRYGCGVGFEALEEYCQDEDRAVGSLRASRVLSAGLQPSPHGKPARGSTSWVKKRSERTLDYNAWVPFFLCEEALRAGACSERDVRYCFAVVDETGEERIGLSEVTPFFEAMVWDRIICHGDEGVYGFPTVKDVVSQYFDAMGVERGRNYICLHEMLQPNNIRRAGRFFEEIFSGKDFQGDGRVEGSTTDESFEIEGRVDHPPPPPEQHRVSRWASYQGADPALPPSFDSYQAASIGRGGGS